MKHLEEARNVDANLALISPIQAVVACISRNGQTKRKPSLQARILHRCRWAADELPCGWLSTVDAQRIHRPETETTKSCALFLEPTVNHYSVMVQKWGSTRAASGISLPNREPQAAEGCTRQLPGERGQTRWLRA